MGNNTASNRNGRGALNRRNFTKAASVGGAVLSTGCLGSLSGGQEWPSRPVEIISPWSAGGGADRMNRTVTDAVENHTDVSQNVSNQTGGFGSVGMNAAINAGPDGHTIGCTVPEITLFEHLDVADLSPDDITPIIQYTELPAVFVVSEGAEFSTLDGQISYGRDNALQMANSGFGSSWRMAATSIASEAGVNAEHISYKGAAPATTAVVNDEIDCATAGAAEVAPQVQDGGLSTLGAAFDQQAEALPNMSTPQGQGLDIPISSWLTHFAPAGIGDELKQQLADVYSVVYEGDSFVEFMENSNFIRVECGPDELQDFLDQQYEFYGNLIGELGIEEQ